MFFRKEIISVELTGSKDGMDLYTVEYSNGKSKTISLPCGDLAAIPNIETVIRKQI